MNITKLTYRQLQSELKAYKLQGLTSIKLNSIYDVLLAEYERLTTVEIVEVQEVQEVKVDVADHMIYQDFSDCSLSQQKRLLNALNFYLTAYGAKEYQLADTIVSCQYRPETDLWQIKYFTPDNPIVKHETMYDSELANALGQTPEVFEPTEEIMEVVSALKEEFAGVRITTGNNKIGLRLGSLVVTFLMRNEELIWCDRRWDMGSQYVNEIVDRHYKSHSQMQSLLAQLRSDFWFELEVVEVA